MPGSRAYKLVSREVKPDDTFVQPPGPTAAGSDRRRGIRRESPAPAPSRAGTDLDHRDGGQGGGRTFLRGARSSLEPHPIVSRDEEEGLALLAEARAATGLPIVTEVMDPRDVDLGPPRRRPSDRRAQHAKLLAARSRRWRRQPLLLKGGLSATIQEFLMAAEYIVKQGTTRWCFANEASAFETMTPTPWISAPSPSSSGSRTCPHRRPFHGTGDRQSFPPWPARRWPWAPTG